MKSMIIALVAAVAFVAPAFAEDAKPGALNANCYCGKPADASIAPVTIKVDGVEKQVAVCCADCSAAVAKMEPKEAWKAVEAHNKKTEAVK